MGSVRIASFDIGRCNFSQYIEDFDAEVIFELEERYSKLPQKLQRRVKGVMNNEISDILNDIVMSGDRVSTGVYDFTTEVGQGLDLQARLGLLNHLSRFKGLWDTCDIFVIEQQFFNATAFGGKKKRGTAAGANVDAIKVGEATFMWFLERYPTKEICYFGSQFKTQIFGAPWKMSKPERKKWATDKAEEFYRLREDKDMANLFDLAEAVKRKRISTEERIQTFKVEYPCEDEDTQELADKVIRNKQKLDDVADAFMQCQAFKFRTMVACF